MKEIRLLKASEIECRVGQCGRSQKGVAWCALLLYKDARCDQRILDELFGMFGWQRRHEPVNGQVCCIVKVKDPETGEWIEKEDVGTESNTEAIKGQFSDSFKRACFNLGIGRELYTAPKIFVTLTENEAVEKNGRVSLSAKCVFSVKEIGYDKDRNINRLVIVDNNGKERYVLGRAVAVTNDDALSSAMLAIQHATSHDDLRGIYESHPQLQQNSDFTNALNERYSEITSAA